MKKLLLLFFVSIIAIACGTQKKLLQTKNLANQYYYQKKYDSAYINYQKLIDSYESKGLNAEAEIYAAAGKSLFYAGQKAKGIDYLNTAEQQGFEDEQSLFIKANYYQSINNLSKETLMIEKYIRLYPDGPNIQEINKRGFITSNQTKNYQSAITFYEKLSTEEKNKIENLETIYNVYQKTNNIDDANAIAEKLYQLDSENLIGLNYKAYSVYTAAENEYVAAIKAYEAKKTQSNYKTMRTKVQNLAPKYRQARDLYLKLYNKYHRKNDAAYLARIYTRLNDPQTAKKYEKLSKN